MTVPISLYLTTVESPIGCLTVACSEAQAVFIHFPHEAGSMEAQWRAAGYAPQAQPNPLCLRAKQELEAYFSGTLFEFPLPLALHGTPFQVQILRQLQAIPYGHTQTYGELAHQAGYPRAARAVGTVMAKNRLPIVLPCHRVLAAGNHLGGYGGGLDAKDYLLQLERTALARSIR